MKPGTTPALFIGLMSGTSLDGVDGVLAHFAADGTMRVLASATVPFDAAFRCELLSLNTPGANELHRSALAGNQIALHYARVVDQLREQARSEILGGQQIAAVGAHGQTVRHQPGHGSDSYTLQLINPALLAERTGLTVVADFRSRDIAAGGQGAPLVPAFHRQVFAQPGADVAVLNLGGIANLSVLPADPAQPVLGFDCGPGNVLLDAWCQQHTAHAYDAGGHWGAGGNCLPALLQTLQDEPFFALPPPKSTGRDLFSPGWLQDKLSRFASARPQDVQATLAELTASACATCVDSYAKNSKQLIVCGGGAFNVHLLQRLQSRLPATRVLTSDRCGLPAMQVEAAAFAWLARQTMLGQAGNLAAVTGATGPRILGAIYPA